MAKEARPEAGKDPRADWPQEEMDDPLYETDCFRCFCYKARAAKGVPRRGQRGIAREQPRDPLHPTRWWF